MTNMQAALGMAQLERLDEFVERKRKMGALYTELLKDIPGLELPLAATRYAENIYWVYAMVLNESSGLDKDAAITMLADNGVATRPFFYPMHQQPALRKAGYFQDEAYPVAERLYRQGLYIPSGMGLTETQIRTVVETVKHILNGAGS